MGGVLSQPVELIRVQRRGSSAFKCAVAEMQGWRIKHEDAHAMHCNGRTGSFWVLDGHGGDGAANFGAVALAQEIGEAMTEGSMPADDQIEQGFQAVDRKFAGFIEANPGTESGSTVVGALVVRRDDGSYSIKMLNCGDSRGVVLRRPGAGEETSSVLLESVDHKPNLPGERARIEAAGGFVCGDKVARIDGTLAVSRGIGDFEFKDDSQRPVSEQKVSCIPDVYELSNLEPETILILGCDGLWDVMSGDDVAKIVRTRLHEQPEADLGDIAAELVRRSLESQSGDNVTVMIVQFTDGSGWDNEPDEMKEFEKLQNGDALSEDVRDKYLEFLKRTDFPPQPCLDGESSRWILCKEQSTEAK